MTAEQAKRTGQARKSIEEIVTYTVGHRIRVEIMMLLNEGRDYAHVEIAEILDQPMNKIGNHLRELLDAGMIEIIEARRDRNFTRHVYRSVEVPFYTDEEIAALTPEHRQITYGLVIKQMMAEVMASFWAGKIRDDPRAWIASNWINLDEQGRQDIADEQQRSWERLEEIEVESIERSGEDTTSYVVGQIGFERARRAPKPPRSPDDE